MKSFLVFMIMVAAFLLYGLAFDSVINTVSVGQYCSAISEGSCLIPAQMDRWLTILTLVVFLPSSVIGVIHWFFNSRRRVSTLFGWIFVVP